MLNEAVFIDAEFNMTNAIRSTSPTRPALRPIEAGTAATPANTDETASSPTRNAGILGNLPGRPARLQTETAAPVATEFVNYAAVDGAVKCGLGSDEIAKQVNARRPEDLLNIQWNVVNGGSPGARTMHTMTTRTTPTPAHKALFGEDGNVTAVARDFGITEAGPLEQLQWHAVNGPLMQRIMRGRFDDVEKLAGDSGITASAPLERLRMLGDAKAQVDAMKAKREASN